MKKLEGAYAEGTLRAYQADIQAYIDWCDSEKLRPFPANPKSMASFIEKQANSYSASTLKRRLAAIGKIHELLNLYNPIKSSDVKLAVRRALRAKPSRPRQALGLSPVMRDQLIEACDNSLSGKRDKALIAIGYDTLCRRSEIVAIQVEDIEIHNGNCGKILIRRSKSDQLSMGRIAYLSPRSMQLIKDWLKEAKLESGPLFRAIKQKNIQSRGLHAHTANKILKKCAARAGIPDSVVRRLSGHSMRIGAAQEMMQLGFDILPIMVAGGWKSTNVVARYIENADMSHLLRKFHKR